MAFLQPGSSADVVISAAQRVIIGANRAAIASISIPLGLPGGPSDTVVGTTKTYGPFPAGATVNIEAVAGSIEYAVGASPVLTDQQLNPASVALTGGTMNGVSVGVTTPAIVKASDFQAARTDISGTPGNGTASNPRGRAAFAAAGSTVTVTSTLCIATSSVFVQLGGADATLTSVRVTPGAGSFVVTGNAAATATTPFDFHVIN